MRFIFLIALMFTATGCISTSIKGFTDPDYSGYKIHKLLVFAPIHVFDDAFENKLRSSDVVYSFHTDLFLPTRSYTVEDQAEIIRSKGYDSFLVIRIEDESASSSVAAYNTTRSTNYNSAGSTSSGTIYPITSNKRSTTSKATLYDASNGRMIWVASLSTKATGTAHIDINSTIYSMAEKIITTLTKDGHLSRASN